MKRVLCSVTGVLREYLVKPGDTVNNGQEVAIVESMKMMIPVLAEQEGTVSVLSQKLNETVHEGDTLMEFA